MNEKTALTLAQRWVKAPYKNKKTGEWIIEWLNGTTYQKETFSSRSDAYSFFYNKISELKNKIINNNSNNIKRK